MGRGLVLTGEGVWWRPPPGSGVRGGEQEGAGRGPSGRRPWLPSPAAGVPGVRACLPRLVTPHWAASWSLPRAVRILGMPLVWEVGIRSQIPLRPGREAPGPRGVGKRPQRPVGSGGARGARPPRPDTRRKKPEGGGRASRESRSRQGPVSVERPALFLHCSYIFWKAVSPRRLSCAPAPRGSGAGSGGGSVLAAQSPPFLPPSSPLLVRTGFITIIIFFLFADLEEGCVRGKEGGRREGGGSLRAGVGGGFWAH